MATQETFSLAKYIEALKYGPYLLFKYANLPQIVDDNIYVQEDIDKIAESSITLAVIAMVSVEVLEAVPTEEEKEAVIHQEEEVVQANVKVMVQAQANVNHTVIVPKNLVLQEIAIAEIVQVNVKHTAIVLIERVLPEVPQIPVTKEKVFFPVKNAREKTFNSVVNLL